MLTPPLVCSPPCRKSLCGPQEALNALPQVGKAQPRPPSAGSAGDDELGAPTAVASAPPRKEVHAPDGQLVVDQQDLYSWVFYPMMENKALTFKYKLAVLIEYIRSLNQVHLNGTAASGGTAGAAPHQLTRDPTGAATVCGGVGPVYHYIYELVINLLVSNNRCYQLHQLMQYHVVRDSEHVACLLLSLVPKYAPAYQLAIDMLKRLGTYEDIVEVLLVKQQVRRPARAGVAVLSACLRPHAAGRCPMKRARAPQVITAIRFLRSHDYSGRVQAAQFLEAAAATNDRAVRAGRDRTRLPLDLARRLTSETGRISTGSALGGGARAQLFYSVYKYFEARNQYLHNTIEFPPQENCGKYVAMFKEMFPEDAGAAGSGPQPSK